MRLRLTFISVLLVMGAVSVFPMSAAAADNFTHQVVYNYCHGADPHFKVKNIAAGASHANRLTTETWVEKRPGGSHTWTKTYSWPVAKYKFSINGDKHWLTSWRTWNGDRFNWYRIGFRLRAWHNTNLLSTEVIYSRKC